MTLFHWPCKLPCHLSPSRWSSIFHWSNSSNIKNLGLKWTLVYFHYTENLKMDFVLETYKSIYFDPNPSSYRNVYLHSNKAIKQNQQILSYMLVWASISTAASQSSFEPYFISSMSAKGGWLVGVSGWFGLVDSSHRL